eukprot:TRINITY_DN1464_c2_g1_i1.p1 TRINITY_DN1464_c2_g1~~TRINITY_DN1464_c2_g1_i1.p1  ORF type:complete len:126 (+),score=11.47 TRINITY_DN1464_c2_g1_i1:115-492(+)
MVVESNPEVEGLLSRLDAMNHQAALELEQTKAETETLRLQLQSLKDEQTSLTAQIQSRHERQPPPPPAPLTSLRSQVHSLLSSRTANPQNPSITPLPHRAWNGGSAPPPGGPVPSNHYHHHHLQY